MSFEAKYHGRCAADCGEWIEPGDQVEHDADDHLVHVRCDTQPNLDTPTRTERRCPDCWTWHAGECL